MGKVQNFYIRYENRTNNVYFGGQTLVGRVFLVLNEPMKMRGLRVKVVGSAHTEWTESKTRHTSNGTQTYHETYTGYQSFIDSVVTVWGKVEGQSGDDPVMPAGSYEFPFSCLIPMNCPSSFEGTYGYIRYLCKAVIDRPWRFDHKCSVPFTLVGTVDLNHDPVASTRIEDSKSKELGCMCCVGGSVECQVRVPRCGYVPGESIPLNIEVYNKSSSDVEEVTVNLVQNVVFTATHGWSEHTRFSNREVTSLQKGLISPGDSQSWEGSVLQIPPIPPSIKTCSIIDSSYELQILVNPVGCHSRLKMFFPIIIGNIPLRSVYQTFPMPVAPAIPFAPTTDGVSPSAPSSLVEPSAPPPAYGEYPDLPPPTYEETTLGGGAIEPEDEHDTGPKNFAPRYPYYKYLAKGPNEKR